MTDEQVLCLMAAQIFRGGMDLPGNAEFGARCSVSPEKAAELALDLMTECYRLTANRFSIKGGEK